MTLVEVIDAARDILNEPLSSGRSFPDNSSGFWRDTTLQGYHNLAQVEVAQEIIQTFEDHFITDSFLNISAGVNRYGLPSTFVKMRRVEDLRGGGPIEIMPVRLNEGGYYTPLGSINDVGLQAGYHLEGSSIVFEGTPTYTQNSSVRIWFIKNAPDVTAGTNSSELPTEAHRALVWGICKYAMHQQQADNNFAAIEFEKHIRKIKEQAENRQVQTPRRVYIRRKHLDY
jgi:hypothetical protein